MKKILIISILLIQSYIVFIANYPIAHSLIAAHIALDCGRMFDQGVTMFMDRKHKFDLVLFFTSLILMLMIVWTPRQTKKK